MANNEIVVNELMNNFSDCKWISKKNRLKFSAKCSDKIENLCGFNHNKINRNVHKFVEKMFKLWAVCSLWSFCCVNGSYGEWRILKL